MGLTEKMELDLTSKTAETLFEGDGGSFVQKKKKETVVVTTFGRVLKCQC